MQEEDRAAAAEAAHVVAQVVVPGLPGPQLVGAPTQEEVTAVLTLVIIEAIMFL